MLCPSLLPNIHSQVIINRGAKNPQWRKNSLFNKLCWQNAGPTESAPLRTSWVPEPEWLRTRRCMQPRAGLRQFQAEQHRAWAVWAGRAQAPWAGAGPLWLRHCEHTPVLFAASLPPHSMTEQVSLKKCPPPPPCVRVEIRHWRDQQTEEAKTEGTALEVTGAID